MDRAYYQLIEEGIEITRLTTGVIQYADYKPCVKEATDPIIIDCIKELQRTKRMLEEVLKRQQLALERSPKS